MSHHRHHHHGHHHDRGDRGHRGCGPECRERRDYERSRCGCCCCRGCCRPCGHGGEREGRYGQRGPGRGFDEKRLVDTIVRLVTENVGREVESIVNEAFDRLRAEPPPPPSCPECGK